MKKESASGEIPTFKYTLACAEAEGELSELLGSVYAGQAICEAISQVVVAASTQPLLAQEGEVGRKVWQASIRFIGLTLK